MPLEILSTCDPASSVTLFTAAMDTHAPKDDFGIDDEEVRSLLDGIKRLGGLDDELESRLVELLCVGGQSAGEASHMGAKARPILERSACIQDLNQARLTLLS